MGDTIYRLRDPQYAPYITARILNAVYYPFKDQSIYEVEVTDSRKPVAIQTSITPIWDAKHFHEVFEWSSLA